MDAKVKTSLICMLAMMPASVADAASRQALERAKPAALAVANDHWGPDACDGRAKITLMTPAEFAVLGKDGTDAQAVIETCDIQISVTRAMSRTELCAIATHERGHLHLARFPQNVDDPLHSLDQNNIMFATVIVATRRCMEAFQPLLVRQRRARKRSCSPQPISYGWRCGSTDIPAI